MLDATVENHGSLILLQPLTPAAENWIDQNVDEGGMRRWFGALPIEPRYAESIIGAMQEAGLVLGGGPLG